MRSHETWFPNNENIPDWSEAVARLVSNYSRHRRYFMNARAPGRKWVNRKSGSDAIGSELNVAKNSRLQLFKAPLKQKVLYVYCYTKLKIRLNV